MLSLLDALDHMGGSKGKEASRSSSGGCKQSKGSRGKASQPAAASSLGDDSDEGQNHGDDDNYEEGQNKPKHPSSSTSRPRRSRKVNSKYAETEDPDEFLDSGASSSGKCFRKCIEVENESQNTTTFGVPGGGFQSENLRCLYEQIKQQQFHSDEDVRVNLQDSNMFQHDTSMHVGTGKVGVFFLSFSLSCVGSRTCGFNVLISNSSSHSVLSNRT